MGSQRKVIWIEKESECPYRPGELQRIFLLQSTNPTESRTALSAEFLDKGFQFYTKDFMFATNCSSCNACIPLRVDVSNYTPSKSEQRLYRRNEALSVSFIPEGRTVFLTQEHIELFRKYSKARQLHENLADALQYEIRAYLEGYNGMLEIRDEKRKLVAAYIYDRLDDTLNIHTGFFDPDKSNTRTSLGNFALLKLIETARDNGLKHMYLGYWVAGHSRFTYKTRFKNLETLTEDGWVSFDPALHTKGPDYKKSLPPDATSKIIPKF